MKMHLNQSTTMTTHIIVDSRSIRGLSLKALALLLGMLLCIGGRRAEAVEVFSLKADVVPFAMQRLEVISSTATGISTADLPMVPDGIPSGISVFVRLASSGDKVEEAEAALLDWPGLLKVSSSSKGHLVLMLGKSLDQITIPRPPDGSATTYGFTLVREKDIAQGFDGFQLAVYLDGKRTEQKRVSLSEFGNSEQTLTIRQSPGSSGLTVGKVFTVAKGLSAGEVQDIWASLDSDRRSDVGVTAKRNQLGTESSPASLGAWLDEVHRKVRADARFPASPISSVQERNTPNSSDPEALIKVWLKDHPEFVVLKDASLFLLLINTGHHAEVVGLWDRKNEAPLLSGPQDLWRIARLSGNEAIFSKSEEERGQWRSRLLPGGKENEFGIEWSKDGKFSEASETKVRINGSLSSGTLKMYVTIDPSTADRQIAELFFPALELDSVSCEGENLLVPFQCGELRPSPSKSLTEYEGRYPSAKATMAFWSVYDGERGIYCGIHDPTAAVKDFRVAFGKAGVLYTTKWFIPNGPEFNPTRETLGEFVLRPFQGDWFDAGRIYGNWLGQSAPWFPARPRLDSPAWFRENLVWTQGYLAVAKKLREQLGFPIGFHDYGWSDWADALNDIPNFRARPDYEREVARSLNEGLVHMPYMNVRLWAHKDKGKSKEDYMFSKMGLPNAAIQFDGSRVTEDYTSSGGGLFSVMCPSSKGYTDFLSEKIRHAADMGVKAIYLDQLGAGKPVICYENGHGHPPGCGRNWIEHGYRPWMTTLRAELRKASPELALTTEDMAEVTADLIDGFLPWRQFAVTPGSRHVPVFQSIYSGRVQFVGRCFDDYLDPRAYYAMLAEQLVFGEQLFWGYPTYAQRHPARTEFLHRLALARNALLPFLNEGEMQRPPALKGAMVESDWGYYGPRRVKSSAIACSLWGRGKERVLVLVNSTDQRQTATLAPSAILLSSASATQSVFRSSAPDQPFGIEPGQTEIAIELAPYAVEVWLLGASASNSADASNKILKTLQPMSKGMETSEFQDANPSATTSVLPTTPVRYLRIEAPYQHIELAEVEVIAGGINIAPKGKASQSSQTGNRSIDVCGPQKAIDGNTTQKWSDSANNALSATSANLPMEFWGLELPEANIIEKVIIRPRLAPGVTERLRDARLLLLDEAQMPVFSASLRAWVGSDSTIIFKNELQSQKQ